MNQRISDMLAKRYPVPPPAHLRQLEVYWQSVTALSAEIDGSQLGPSEIPLLFQADGKRENG